MPSVKKSSLPVYRLGGYTSAETSFEGMTVAYEKVEDAVDAVERFQQLLDGGCKCPHWGYQLAGRSTYVYADREEVFLPGEFFYIAPGHAPKHEAGSEWVTFSPTDAHAATQAITRNAG